MRTGDEQAMTNNFPHRRAKKDPTSQEAAIAQAKSLFAFAWADTPQQYDALRAATGTPEQRKALLEQDGRAGNPTGAGLTDEYMRNQQEIERLQTRNAEIWQPVEDDPEVAQWEEEDLQQGLSPDNNYGAGDVAEGQFAASETDPAYNEYMRSQGFTAVGDAS